MITHLRKGAGTLTQPRCTPQGTCMSSWMCCTGLGRNRGKTGRFGTPVGGTRYIPTSLELSDASAHLTTTRDGAPANPSVYSEPENHSSGSRPHLASPGHTSHHAPIHTHPLESSGSSRRAAGPESAPAPKWPLPDHPLPIPRPELDTGAYNTDDRDDLYRVTRELIKGQHPPKDKDAGSSHSGKEGPVPTDGGGPGANPRADGPQGSGRTSRTVSLSGTSNSGSQTLVGTSREARTRPPAHEHRGPPHRECVPTCLTRFFCSRSDQLRIKGFMAVSLRVFLALDEVETIVGGGGRRGDFSLLLCYCMYCI